MNFATEQDYEKLRRIVRWILGSIDELAFLGAIDMDTLLSFIDASHRAHQDFKSHTGAASTLGWGVFLPMPSKQKLNTNSSACSELVGVSCCMSTVSYFRLLLDAQGVQLKKNFILQGNKSAMFMENNGKESCSKRSRHLNICQRRSRQR